MTCLPMVQAESLEGVLEENDQLRAKIEGLNEEYNKIGLEVFKVRKCCGAGLIFCRLRFFISSSSNKRVGFQVFLTNF